MSGLAVFFHVLQTFKVVSDGEERKISSSGESSLGHFLVDLFYQFLGSGHFDRMSVCHELPIRYSDYHPMFTDRLLIGNYINGGN